MPKEVKIVNGPSFRGLYSYGPLSSTGSNHLEFTLENPVGTRELLSGSTTKICGPVVGIFRDIFLPENHEARIHNKEVDWLTLIVKHQGLDGEKYDDKYEWCYFVVRYNIVTRKGYGLYFTETEWFSTILGQAILTKI